MNSYACDLKDAFGGTSEEGFFDKKLNMPISATVLPPFGGEEGARKGSISGCSNRRGEFDPWRCSIDQCPGGGGVSEQAHETDNAGMTASETPHQGMKRVSSQGMAGCGRKMGESRGRMGTGGQIKGK